MALLNLVHTAVARESEGRFNEWYATHIETLLTSGEMELAQRFVRLSPVDGDDRAHYLAMYHFADRSAFNRYDASSVFHTSEEGRLREWGPDGFTVTSRAQFEFIDEWRR